MGKEPTVFDYEMKNFDSIFILDDELIITWGKDKNPNPSKIAFRLSDIEKIGITFKKEPAQ